VIALLENLKDHLPFSLLDEKTLKVIEASSQIAYYPEETVIIEEESLPQNVFVIIKGVVKATEGDELTDLYHANDTFGAIEMIRKKGGKDSYVVIEELICFEIPKDVFLNVTKENKAFKTYFLSSLVERMEMMKEKKENIKASEMMLARVDEHLLHSVCLVNADTPIIEALLKLESTRSDALIVKNEFGYGIVTDADLRYYILHKEEDDLKQISQLQSYPAVSVAEDELLFNVLLVMTEHNIKHLPIEDDENNIVGVLELTDLLSYLSNQTHLIAVQMHRAKNLEEVISAASRIDTMINLLHSKGVKSRYIARLVSEINKKMYAKLFDFIFPKEWHKKTTLLLLGSEGRGEQILRTDQDNAIIFENGFDPEDKEEVLLNFIETLDKVGFPRCKGNVMVINPKWARELDGYKAEMRKWINTPDTQGLLDMAIFYDTYAVAGNIELFKELRTFLFRKVQSHKEYLSYFAKSIESFDSPLGLFSRFIMKGKGHKNEIDIKKGALFSLIHGVRALALEYSITKTNTTERIKELNNVGYMNKEEAKDLLETLEMINTLRLSAQLDKLQDEKEINNYICLTTLGKLERDTLKEALKSVENFKKRVSYHFHLSMVG
jgi:CBS domain-containing protein